MAPAPVPHHALNLDRRDGQWRAAQPRAVSLDDRLVQPRHNVAHLLLARGLHRGRQSVVDLLSQSQARRQIREVLVAKLLHDVWSAAPWVPPATLGLGVYDGTLTGHYVGVAGVDALFPLAMLTHATFWTDLTSLSADQQTETAWWIRWYAVHRAELGQSVYELTGTDPIDGQSWAAWQPWSGHAGYVFAFRQAGGPESMSLALHGVDAGRMYSVTDVRTGERLGVYRGAQLAAGLAVTVPEYGARVLSVQPLGAR